MFLTRLFKAKRESKKLVLENYQSPGDVLMLTATVRDLKTSYPEYIVDVRTAFPELWEHNPYITKLEDDDPLVNRLRMQYPLIHESNHGSYHFIHCYRIYLEEKLGIRIKQGFFWPDIHFSKEELSWVSMINQHFTGWDSPYWLICTGGKNDYTAKWWIPEYAQEVVNHFKDRIQFVQFGETKKGHTHPPLKGVINLLGKTSIRMFMRLAYHSDGIICPVTFAMHLAAGLPPKWGKPTRKACIVTAGGREPSNFTCYTHHQYLHANGQLPCCADGGCWKSRTSVLGDGDNKDQQLCSNPVVFNGRLVQKCMAKCVTPQDVIRALEKYYEGGALQYLPAGTKTIEATLPEPAPSPEPTK